MIGNRLAREVDHGVGTVELGGERVVLVPVRVVVGQEGLGGEEPTVSDADLVLGYFNADYFLGGKMEVYPDLARAAIERHVAQPLSASATAWAPARTASDRPRDRGWPASRQSVFHVWVAHLQSQLALHACIHQAS